MIAEINVSEKLSPHQSNLFYLRSSLKQQVAFSQSHCNVTHDCFCQTDCSPMAELLFRSKRFFQTTCLLLREVAPLDWFSETVCRVIARSLLHLNAFVRKTEAFYRPHLFEYLAGKLTNKTTGSNVCQRIIVNSLCQFFVSVSLMAYQRGHFNFCVSITEIREIEKILF